jgi:hypothetical protein
MTAKHLIACLIAVTTAATSGCATLMNSGPSTLDATVTYPYQGVTTTVTAVTTKQSSQHTSSYFQVQLDKGSDYVLTMQSPGHRAEQVVVNRTLHPGFWMDMALLLPLVGLAAALAANSNTFLALGTAALVATPLGLAGLGIDLMNNSIWTHDRHQVQVQLTPQP